MSNIVKSRWWIVFLLFTGTFINAIDRGSISTAVPYIMDDLKIDGGMMGVILSSFFWTYLVLNVPTGLVADKLGAKGTLGWSAFVWSMFSAVTGLATRQWQLLIFRMGVGAGEAAVMPVKHAGHQGAFLDSASAARQRDGIFAVFAWALPCRHWLWPA